MALPCTPETSSCSLQGLPPDTTEADIAEYFGTIGVLKQDKKARKPKIWLYRDKDTGGLKGDGTVSYEDPFSAASAVSWFNGKEFKGGLVCFVGPHGWEECCVGV